MGLTRLYWVYLSIAIVAILMASFLLRWTVVEPARDASGKASASSEQGKAKGEPEATNTGAGLVSRLYRGGQSVAPEMLAVDPLRSRALLEWRNREAARFVAILANTNIEAPRLRLFISDYSLPERTLLVEWALDTKLGDAERLLAAFTFAAAQSSEHVPGLERIVRAPFAAELPPEKLVVEQSIRMYAIRGLQALSATAPDARILLRALAEETVDPVLLGALNSSAPELLAVRANSGPNSDAKTSPAPAAAARSDVSVAREAVEIAVEQGSEKAGGAAGRR